MHHTYRGRDTLNRMHARNARESALRKVYADITRANRMMQSKRVANRERELRRLERVVPDASNPLYPRKGLGKARRTAKALDDERERKAARAADIKRLRLPLTPPKIATTRERMAKLVHNAHVAELGPSLASLTAGMSLGNIDLAEVKDALKRRRQRMQPQRKERPVSAPATPANGARKKAVSRSKKTAPRPFQRIVTLGGNGGQQVYYEDLLSGETTYKKPANALVYPVDLYVSPSGRVLSNTEATLERARRTPLP